MIRRWKNAKTRITLALIKDELLKFTVALNKVTLRKVFSNGNTKTTLDICPAARIHDLILGTQPL